MRRSVRRGDTRVSRIAVRTRWFDDEIVRCLTTGDACRVVAVALEAGRGGGDARVAVSLSAPPPRRAHPPRQVVSCGAGMDARPWRLPLPPGTAWFDVDDGRVLAAKRRLLAAAGAGGVPGDGQPTPSPSPPRHPLRAASLAFVEADVAAPRWGTH